MGPLTAGAAPRADRRFLGAQLLWIAPGALLSVLAGCPDFGSPRGPDAAGGGPDATVVEAGGADAAAGGDAASDAAGPDGGATDAESGCPAEPVAVRIRYMSFLPAHVTVSAGCPVVWTNMDGTVIHTVTSGAPERPDGAFDSGDLANGEMFAHVFSTPGLYSYFCRTHPTTMRDATVTVE